MKRMLVFDTSKEIFILVDFVVHYPRLFTNNSTDYNGN